MTAPKLSIAFRPFSPVLVFEVGGDFIFERSADTQVMVQTEVGGDIAVGGTLQEVSSGRVKVHASRDIFENYSVDTQKYLDMFDSMAERSEYWAQLYPNGVVTPALQHEQQNRIVFSAGDDNCLQVFHVDRFDLYGGNTPDVEFDSSLDGKTILINVASTYSTASAKKEVSIPSWGKVIDPSGNDNKDILSPFKSSLLWNFYDAEKVTLGGVSGGPQFPGSLLIPNGDLDFRWPGSDGRVIVGGDVWHQSTGSEFHNYEFDPPCALPLPPDLDMPGECTGETEDLCPSDPTEPFSVDIYVTYAGSSSFDPSSLSSGSITQMENTVVNQYNALSFAVCDPYLREVTGIEMDTSSFIKAMNPTGMLHGFRVKFTISGVCLDCVTDGVVAPLLDVECREATENNCCPDNLEKAVTAKELVEAINANESDSALNVLRIQSLETTGPSSQNISCPSQPGKDVKGYINPMGDLVCLAVA